MAKKKPAKDDDKIDIVEAFEGCQEFLNKHHAKLTDDELCSLSLTWTFGISCFRVMRRNDLVEECLKEFNAIVDDIEAKTTDTVARGF